MGEKIHFKPCPFCGTDLNEYPTYFSIRRVCDEMYVKWLHENGYIAGADVDYVVTCPHCGARGPHDSEKFIVKRWNEREGEENAVD